MMKTGSVWLTSDNHFYHTNIIKYCSRPFVDAPDMNAQMEHHWNELVTPDDIVIVVGDLTAGLGDKKLELFNLIGRLNGRKILVRGNHDHQKDNFYLEGGFKKVVDHMFMGGALFTHFPARVDTEYPHPMHKVALAWKDQYNPAIIIHGHEHGTTHPEHPGHYNCAADRHGYKPFPLQKALEHHNLLEVQLEIVSALENFLAG